MRVQSTLVMNVTANLQISEIKILETCEGEEKMFWPRNLQLLFYTFTNYDINTTV